MSFVAVAIGGAAIIGAGATVYAASESAAATAEAGERTLSATADTNQLQWEMYQQGRDDQEPWRLAGEDALTRLGETPDFQFTNEDFDFFQDPSYQFRMDESLKGLDQSAASRGRVLSGAQDKAIVDYAGNLASQEYNNAFNRSLTTYNTNQNTDLSIAGLGQNATSQTAAAGASVANSITSNTMNSTNALNTLSIADAQAQADAAAGIATSANSAMGNYLLYSEANNEG